MSGFWRSTGETLGLVTPVSESGTQPLERATVLVEGDAPSAILPPSRSASATWISVDEALSIGAVYRAISIIQTSVAQMELTVFRNKREMVNVPPLIKQPDINQSPSAFVEETVFSLAAHGNAFWRLFRNSRGEPVESITVLDPGAVSIRQEDGRTIYVVNGKDLQPWQIKHLKYMRRPGQLISDGPIQKGNKELLAAARLRAFADEWFDVSGVPTGLLSSDQALTPPESAAYAEAWKTFLATHGGTAVLSKGLKYEALHLKPAEAQFLEVQRASVVGIARLFGIPPMHLSAELSGQSNTYTNLEQANLVFLQTALTRYMNEIENALTDLLPRGQVVQFKEEALLRLDTETKWRVLEAQVRVGYTNGDELRANEGKAPLPKPEPTKEEDANAPRP